MPDAYARTRRFLTKLDSTNPKIAQYAHPEVVVTTSWVAEHLLDPNVRVVESDEDVLLYEVGHIPGAVKLDWLTDLQDPIRRDFVDKSGFERLMTQRGIGNDTTVVLYGDRKNWYATYSFWLFKLFGHRDARVMDGGRTKWELEKRAWTRDLPPVISSEYEAANPDLSIRAFRAEVETPDAVGASSHRREIAG